MKACVALLLVLQATLGVTRNVDIAGHHASAKVSAAPEAVRKVVDLIEDLKGKMEAYDADEQKSYDKYACWCEKKMKEKAAAMTEAEKNIASLTAEITKASSQIGTHKAAIVNLKESIKANLESQREAKEQREKEESAFEEAKTEFEAAIKALQTAITVLDGAGTGKKSFLGTLQEAQVLSVVAGVRSVLNSRISAQKLSSDQIKVVDEFVDKPQDFVGNRISGFSAAQTANNPFGDYAPRSTKIAGILGALLDSMKADLEASIKEETAKKEAYKELMGTKLNEQRTLQGSLEVQENLAAKAAMSLADDKQERDETQEELATTKAYFEATKKSCKETAHAFSERVRLRTEELHGISQAIAILTSKEAIESFEGSGKTLFIQLRSTKGVSGDRRQKAYLELKKLATDFKSMAFAQIAAEVTAGGHFDTIISLIDVMIQGLRDEEASDIKQRDLCQMKQSANANEMSSLNSVLAKAGTDKDRLSSYIKDISDEIKDITGSIEKAQEDLAQLSDERETAHDDYKKALEADEKAVVLLGKAIEYLKQFYVNNKKSLGLMQKHNAKHANAKDVADPEYAVDKDAAPKLAWKEEYEGSSSETGGVVSILLMIKEDTLKEALTLKKDEKEAKMTYIEMKDSLEANIAAQKKLRVSKQKEVENLNSKLNEIDEVATSKKEELDSEETMKKSLVEGCDWVATNFETRRQKRKMEMDGLVEAKSYLAGVDGGTPVLPVDF